MIMEETDRNAESRLGGEEDPTTLPPTRLFTSYYRNLWGLD